MFLESFQNLLILFDFWSCVSWVLCECFCCWDLVLLGLYFMLFNDFAHLDELFLWSFWLLSLFVCFCVVSTFLGRWIGLCLLWIVLSVYFWLLLSLFLSFCIFSFLSTVIVLAWISLNFFLNPVINCLDFGLVKSQINIAFFQVNNICSWQSKAQYNIRMRAKIICCFVIKVFPRCDILAGVCLNEIIAVE